VKGEADEQIAIAEALWLLPVSFALSGSISRRQVFRGPPKINQTLPAPARGCRTGSLTCPGFLPFGALRGFDFGQGVGDRLRSPREELQKFRRGCEGFEYHPLWASDYSSDQTPYAWAWPSSGKIVGNAEVIHWSVLSPCRTPDPAFFRTSGRITLHP
jgi:hypothetical protein